MGRKTNVVFRQLKITADEALTNGRGDAYEASPHKRRFPLKLDEFHERYSITIKPKLVRRSSLSELTTNASDLNLLDTKFLAEETARGFFNDCVGDHCIPQNFDPNYMSWSLKKKKKKKGNEMSNTYGTQFANEYIDKTEPDINPSESSIADNSSTCSTGSIVQNPNFPFESTPSGNLKVQTNQVVFQSSTVGVLLVVADPDKTKVKVQFEGNSGEVPDPPVQQEEESTFNQADMSHKKLLMCNKSNCPEMREDRGKDLGSLGYTMPQSIDWNRIQLPKKVDLFQEFYRRIHNFINTDTVVHIGEEDIHCHHMVLQVYSTFFEKHDSREIELPQSKVSPETFHTIYEWMIFGIPDSNRLLKPTNILDIFLAAQYLSIKDLEEQCWAFIVNDSIFNEDTAFTLFTGARQKGVKHIMDLMLPRINRFFLPLVASNDYLELEPDVLMTLLKSNYICVTSELEILMSGIRWLYGDWSRRQHLAVTVMSCIRFGLISPWQLVDLKRNPDNAEIFNIVNDPDVQQMVDDGLAYVIIKYWYGNNSKDYYHWIDVLGLTEPAERNWIGEEKNHVTYKDFLKYLEQFNAPKDQVYKILALMQPTRRNDDVSGNLRGMDADKMEMRRPKMDFPLPANLQGFSANSFPTMSEFFENKRQVNKSQGSPQATPSPAIRHQSVTQKTSQSPPSPIPQGPRFHERQLHPDNANERNEKEPSRFSETVKTIPQSQDSTQPCCFFTLQEQEKISPSSMRRPLNVQQVQECRLESRMVYETQHHKSEETFEPPERDSTEENATLSDSSSSPDSSMAGKVHHGRRHSLAATYLAAATAALSTKAESPTMQTNKLRSQPAQKHEIQTRPQATNMGQMSQDSDTPQISLFNKSKELVAKRNMNKLSTSVLGPSNKNYVADGSLFNWDRETVLVFGGIDPHAKYGVGRNTGKDIHRFDPVTNVWDYVGELPEPRHHHSVAILRGRVYLVGGADPRDDDVRGRSVVVSTVWSYEPVSRSWYSESGLAVPRKNFGLVVHHMSLYAIGGLDKKGRVISSVEKFDPKSSTWTKMRPMLTARMAVAATKYRDYIWVAGGMTGEKKKPVCKVVECYNAKTDEWTKIHDLRFPRCFATMFSMNDKLFIIGGAGRVFDKDKTASSVDSIDVWDWTTREWRQHTEMSIPRHGHALAYLGTQLFIIGGVTTIYMRALNNVESFCCERNAWIRGVATLPSPLSGHGSVTLPPASLM